MLTHNNTYQKMSNKLRLTFIHVCGAILFLLFPILISPDITEPTLFKIVFFRIDFFNHFFLLIFFYINFFILVPYFYFNKKFIVFYFSIVICYCITSYFPILITHHNYLLYGRNFPYYLGQSMFKFLSVFIFSILIKTNNKWKYAEQKKINAELSFLKAQINPHFLFNTLNSIYSTAITENAKNTSTAVVKLSALLRYITSVTDKQFVPLSKELAYIGNYIDLQKNRFQDTIQLTYTVEGEITDQQIVPLVLIAFIENAFKHGVNPEEESFIHISIAVKEATLTFNIRNNKVNQTQEPELSSGLGIDNTKKRLQLIYPNKHLLQIDNTAKQFAVSLTIQIR